MHRLHLLWCAPLVLAGVVVGCGNVVSSFDDDGVPAPDDGWCDDSPGCDHPDTQVAECPAGASCYTVGGCSGPPVTCQECTACSENESEVSFCGDVLGCTARTGCDGKVFFCVAPCEPAHCNTGDVPFGTCPEGQSCYQVFGCGASVSCLKIPQDGCPAEQQLVVGSDCGNDPTLVCDYPDALDCWHQFACVDVEGANVWQDDGHTCVLFPDG